ncbi:hypothetical protein pb186bvf_003619 [Paramecium bursaria]
MIKLKQPYDNNFSCCQSHAKYDNYYEIYRNIEQSQIVGLICQFLMIRIKKETKVIQQLNFALYQYKSQ